MTIRVRVLYFAQAREAAGMREEELSLPGRSSVRSLVARSVGAHARLGRMLGTMRVAVNEEIAGQGRVLADGDIVAFLPPVAGG